MKNKYYAKLRPVSIGTQPNNGFVGFVNYDERKEVNGKMVWGELYYNRELTEQEMKNYDLIKEVDSMTMEQMEQKISEIIDAMPGVNGDGGIEIYTDYRDRELGNHLLKKIFEADSPKEYFEEMIWDWETDYALDYGYDDLETDIRAKLTEEENEYFSDNFEEVWNFIREKTYFYYDIKDFNNDIKVNIMVDCGNANYDYTCDNVLNWYGRHSKGKFEEESSMLWLAGTQGKAEELKEVCREIFTEDGDYVDRDKAKDKFVESCIQELENFPSHMGTVTFLVEMPLLQLFDLLDLQKAEYDPKAEFDPRLNKSESYILLDKATMCGIFDPWSGGGSVLEIELDKDVKLPVKYAKICIEGCKEYGYDVDEVYGLCGSAWGNTVKEIHKMEV